MLLLQTCFLCNIRRIIARVINRVIVDVGVRRGISASARTIDSAAFAFNATLFPSTWCFITWHRYGSLSSRLFHQCSDVFPSMSLVKPRVYIRAACFRRLVSAEIECQSYPDVILFAEAR
jgi:hypothetical protein